MTNEEIAEMIARQDDLKSEIARLQKSTLGRCASCGRWNVIVSFDREAMICVDFDACWAVCRENDARDLTLTGAGDDDRAAPTPAPANPQSSPADRGASSAGAPDPDGLTAERLTEAELREAVEWITARSPHWRPRNEHAVQRLRAAITELLILRQYAAARSALADAAERWGRARQEEESAKQMGYEANHRGPAWFARCVAGDTRMEAERDLFEAWQADVAARRGAAGTGEGED